MTIDAAAVRDILREASFLESPAFVESMDREFASWLATRYYPVSGRTWSYEEAPYTLDIARSVGPWNAIMKAAQIRMTEFTLALAAWFVITKRANAIYFLPGAELVTDISQQRLATAIERSPYLLGMLDRAFRVDAEAQGAEGARQQRVVPRTADRIGLKRLGDGWLYLRNGSKLKLVSIPSDLNIYDEFELMDKRVAAMAPDRLGHSLYKWEFFLSVPGEPGKGIDELYQKGSQGRWENRCTHCGTWQELEWEKNVLIDVPKIVCARCRKPIDRLANGRWTHGYPDRVKAKRTSWRVSKFVSTRATFYPGENPRVENAGEKTLVDKFLEAESTRDPTKTETFWRSDMCRPFAMRGSGLTETDLKDAIGEHGFEPRGTTRPTVMGVDVGTYFHCTIHRYDAGRMSLVWLGKVGEIAELEPLIRAFRVARLVMDERPEQHLVRAFAAKYRGIAILADYDTRLSAPLLGKLERITVSPNEGKVCDRVKVGRNLVHEEIRTGMGRRQVLPRGILDAMPDPGGGSEYVRHMLAPKRRLEEISPGDYEVRWASSGPDHFFSATIYAFVAWLLAPKSIRPRAELVGGRIA